MSQAVERIYTLITTNVGNPEPAAKPISAPGGAPFSTYGIQVVPVGGSLTSWTVTLEGSLDGVNWTVLVTHNATAGSTQWETTGKPCKFVRANVSALSLNTATSITVLVTAVP